MIRVAIYCRVSTDDQSCQRQERDLLEFATRARGKKLGRQPGQTDRIQRLTPKVLKLVEQRCSYRQVARDLRISKTTVMEIVKRHRASAHQ